MTVVLVAIWCVVMAALLVVGRVLADMPSGVHPFDYVRAHLIAWWYNLRNRVGFFVSRHFVRLTPRCECSWPLVQRFDGPWVCGRCLNGSDHGCPCYLCLANAKREEEVADG